MPITVWSKDKDSPSLLHGIELEIGEYRFEFNSNVITRNTILQIAQNRIGKPLSIAGRILTIISVKDDQKTIVIDVNISKESSQEAVEAGIVPQVLVIGTALGALGLLVIVFLEKVTKLDIAKNVGQAIGNLFSGILLNPGVLVVIVIAIVAFAWMKTR